MAAGESDLFTDPRISWAFERLGGVEGKTVLDLGPLEGAHSYMAEKAGASRVVGVEANTKAYLKCLVTKEVFDLQKTSFLCGDVMPYLAEASEQFDVCIACGLLYHMVEPVRLIELISPSASSLVLWTHVYDDVVLERRDLAASFSPARAAVHGDFNHHLYRHRYGPKLGSFFGGTASHSNWLSREDLMRALDHFGWTGVEVAFEEMDHPNGPALALVAVRDGS